MFTAIQRFICAIYGSTKKTITEVRFDLFYQMYQNQNKLVDMSTLPPCEPVLFLHVKRLKILAICRYFLSTICYLLFAICRYFLYFLPADSRYLLSAERFSNSVEHLRWSFLRK